MADITTLPAQTRTTFGKGAARQLRRAGKTPAVIYGHGEDPRHVALPAHELSLVTRRSNALIELDIEGTSETVLVKDIQRDPVLQIIEHVDLVIVKKGEKVEVEVPLHIEGEPVSPAIANLDVAHLTINVPAISIPEHIVVRVEGLEEGQHVAASAIVLPDGAELLTDPDTVVVTIAVPAEEPEPAAADEAAPAAPAAEAAE